MQAGRSWADVRAEDVAVEDEAILVLNKPAGVSLVGERHGTDLMQLAKAAGEQLYPVHRVDKVTSGLVLLARELPAHGAMTRQFARRTVEKAYLAVTASQELPEEGTIDLPLMTAGSGRVRVAADRARIALDEPAARWGVEPGDVFGHARSYPSATVFRRVWQGGGRSLLVVRPVTGRRHQIRVHLAWTGHAIAGDPLFDKAAAARGDRTLLHSWQLRLRAPWRPKPELMLRVDPRDDFWAGAEAPPDELLAAARDAYFALDVRYRAALTASTAEGDGGDL